MDNKRPADNFNQVPKTFTPLLYSKALDDRRVEELEKKLDTSPARFLEEQKDCLWQVRGDWLCLSKNLFQSEKRKLFCEKLTRAIIRKHFPTSNTARNISHKTMIRDAHCFIHKEIFGKGLKGIAKRLRYKKPFGSRSAITFKASRFKNELCAVLFKLGCRCSPVPKELAVEHFKRIEEMPSDCLRRLRRNKLNSWILINWLEEMESLVPRRKK